MQLAEVVGTVVATVKSDGLEGVRFLIVQPLDRNRKPKGRPVVAADAVAMAGRWRTCLHRRQSRGGLVASGPVRAR